MEIIPSNVKYKLRTLSDMEIDSKTRTSNDILLPRPEVLGPQASFKLTYNNKPVSLSGLRVS